MTLKHFYASACLILFSIFCANAQTKSVTLTEAGKLSGKLSEAELTTLTDLTISGPLNGADILTLRAMAGNLKVLNLKEANIVEDKVNSYRGSGATGYYTQNDVIGDYMFYGMTALTKVVLPKNVWSIGTWDQDSPWREEEGIDGKKTVTGEPKVTNCYGDDDIQYPGSAAFARCVNLQEVELPATLLWIGNKTFSYCIKLASISIPEGVEAMGSYTFNKCQELTTVSIPFSLGIGKKISWYVLSEENFNNINGSYYNDVSYFGWTFNGCTKLSNVTIADGIKRLAPNMFYGCAGITTITLPNSLLRLNSALIYCSGLTSLQLPAGLTETGSFEGCSGLTSLEIPNGVTALPEGKDWGELSGCFVKCTSLSSVTLPNQLTAIPSSAFTNCTALTSITIPNTVTYIGSNAFFGCTSLAQVTLSTETSSIGQNAFNSCTSLSEINLPNKLIILAPGAFGNTALKSVTLPQSMTEIGHQTFQGCKQLESINFPPNITDIRTETFQGCERLKNITLPNGLMTIQDRAFADCKSLVKIIIPGGVQAVATGAFQDSGLTEVVLNDGVISLGNDSFAGCNLLKTVTFPPSMKSISGFSKTGIQNLLFAEGAAPEEVAANAFIDCDSLRTVTLPATIKKIGTSAFQNCDSLKNMTLPTSITEIADKTFQNCYSLHAITIPEGVTSIGFSAFEYCHKLATATLPTTLKTLGEGTFRGSGMETITIPEGVTELPNYCFANCDSLVSVSLPTSLTKINYPAGNNYSDYGAFYNCNRLQQVDLSKSKLTELPNYTFYECPKLQSIDLSASTLTSIEPYTFRDCTNLKSVKLPETITTIKDNAFGGCNIETINFPATLTSIGNSAFSYNRIAQLSLPAALTAIGDYAFEDGRNGNITIPASVTKIGNRAFESTEVKGTLDITPASGLQLGDASFNCAGNYSVPKPGGGYNYFNFRLYNVNWNSTTQLPKDKFCQIDNLYLPEGGTVSNKQDIRYIFYNGITDSIAIAATDNQYRVSKAMKTKKVTYNKDFNSTSGYGEAAGWKTMVLPFDVKEFTWIESYYTTLDKPISLAPFGSKALETANTLPFWLYELGADGTYTATTEMKAHQAYLICMPNNDVYPNDSRIRGTVKFSATDVTNGVVIGTTEGALKRSIGTKFDMMPTYSNLAAHDSIYSLNEDQGYNGSDDKYYPNGSVFVKSLTHVSPFQAYLVTKEAKAGVARAPMYYSIGGGNGDITGINPPSVQTPDQATKAYSRNGVLYIHTDANRTIKIYNVSGQLVRSIDAHEGANTVTGLGSGTYFLEGQKVMVGQ